MYESDLQYLCCPISGEQLVLGSVEFQSDCGDIIEGSLENQSGSISYHITNGIPRFVTDLEYNASWDYKWDKIDNGKALNYKILDKNDPAYAGHDLFDRNRYDRVEKSLNNQSVILDVGCGIGQYSVKTARQYNFKKIISMDLTKGVDIFRDKILRDYPELRQKILIIQGNIFEPPVQQDSVDYLFSFGVLMHTGDTRKAIKDCSNLCRIGGLMNIWVYCPIIYHIDVTERDRPKKVRFLHFFKEWTLYYIIMFQISIMRRLPIEVNHFILKIFSSPFYYKLSKLKIFGRMFRVIFRGVDHPDYHYRLINNFDGWVNTWADTWTLEELFPTIDESNCVIRGVSNWRTGFLVEKTKAEKCVE